MLNFDVYAIIIQLLLLRKQILIQFEIDLIKSSRNFHPERISCSLNLTNEQQSKQIIFNGMSRSSIHLGTTCIMNGFALHYLAKTSNNELERQIAHFTCPDSINDLNTLNKYLITVEQTLDFNWKVTCKNENNSVIVPLQSIPLQIENEAINSKMSIFLIDDPLKQELIKILLNNNKREVESPNEKQIHTSRIIIQLIGKLVINK
ncbi:hypothetical protein ACQ4LE_009524 [Meloidogyne hapla]